MGHSPLSRKEDCKENTIAKCAQDGSDAVHAKALFPESGDAGVTSLSLFVFFFFVHRRLYGSSRLQRRRCLRCAYLSLAEG